MPQRVVGAAIEDVEAARPPRADGWWTYRDAAKVLKTTARLPRRAVPILVINVILAAPRNNINSAGAPGNRSRRGGQGAAQILPMRIGVPPSAVPPFVPEAVIRRRTKCVQPIHA